MAARASGTPIHSPNRKKTRGSTSGSKLQDKPAPLHSIDTPLTGWEKAVIAGVLLLSAVLFFQIAFSQVDNFLKAAGIIADLVFSGMILRQLLHAEGYYGAVMVRSKQGLELMDRLGGRHARLAREIADFGVTLSFGIPAAWFLYCRKGGRENYSRLAVHAALVGIFFYWLQLQPAASSFLNQFTLVLGLFLGLFGLGYSSLIASAAGILTSKTAVSTVAPVVPGITLPLWEGLIAIAIAAIVHEVAHGVLARAEGLKVLSSGAILFGFLPIGAFVEPDEQAFSREPILKKRRILVAGSASNFIFFLIFLTLAYGASQAIPFLSQGVAVTGVEANSTAHGLLQNGDVITAVNGIPVRSAADFNSAAGFSDGEVSLSLASGRNASMALFTLSISSVVPQGPSDGALKPGDVIEFIDGKAATSASALKAGLQSKGPGGRVQFGVLDARCASTGEGAFARCGRNETVTLDSSSRMGVNLDQSLSFQYANKAVGGLDFPLEALVFILGVFAITAFLNFALAIINVLPMFVTDGQRMFLEELNEVIPRPRYGDAGRKIALAMAILTLALLLVNLGRWFKFI